MALDDELKNSKGAAKDLNEDFKSLYDTLRGVTSELKGQVTEVTKSRDAYRQFEKAAQDFKLQQEGIQLLTDKQVYSYSAILDKQLAIALQEGERLVNNTDIGKELLEEVAVLKELGATQDEINDTVSELLRQTNDLTEEQQALLSAYFDENRVLNDIVATVDQEVKRRNEVNRALGISGNLLEGIEEIGGKIGKAFKIDKIAEDMREFAYEAAEGGKKVSRLAVFAKGVQSAFKNLRETLTDPAVVVAAMVEGFNKVDKAQKEFRQTTGQNISAFETLNGEITTSSEYIKAASELSKELGVNASVVFSKETIVEVAELTDNMGMAAKEAANLAKLSKASGTELKENAHAIEHGFKSFVKQNGTALNFGQIMGDVGKASSALTISLGSNPEKIAKAAMEARKLGLSLEQVDKIAESLLNFEESISNELEAELLTGKDLNLEKAREAALNNDIATLSKEIGKNQEVLSSFSSGNRIQQEAIAKSMGMSREEMANMIYQQKIQNGLSAEQAAKAADISLEEAKRQTAQEQITKALDKFTQLLGLVLTPINWLLSNSVALGTVFTVLAVATFPKILSGVKGLASGLKDSLSTTKDLAKGFLGLFKKGGLQEAGGKIKNFFSGTDKTKELTDKAGDDVNKTADKTKGIKGNMGKDIKNFLTNLSKGIQSFSAVKPGDILKLAGSALALVALTPAIPSLLLLQLVNGPKVKSALKGIADGLVAFGKSAQGLTKVAPYILLAELLIAGFGAALIPLTYALSLLTPLVEAFGKVVGEVFKGIATVVTAVADGFVKLLDSITLEKAAALVVLGAGFMSLAAGLGMFALAVAAAGITSFFAGDGIITQIEQLAEMSGPLQTTASALTQMAVALMGVATALNQIDTDKLDSLNDFAISNSIGNAVGGIVSAITAPIEALGGMIGGGKGENNELAEIKSILQQILAKETNIYMDSTKVGTGFAMGTSKVQ